MSGGTGIEWTDETWNPVTGCTKVSAGCKHCYAETMAKRLQAMGSPKYEFGFAVKTHEEVLEQPLRWTRPRRIFVNSMSDLFHKDVPDAFIQRVFEVMRSSTQHEFQVLTKRPERMADMLEADLLAEGLIPWPPNVLLGTSVEREDVASDRLEQIARMHAMRSVRFGKTFLSAEPLLGPLDLREYLYALDWVIVGGESGTGARPIEADWVRSIRDQCVEAGVPFFFKQWGGSTGPKKKAAGRELDGREWMQFPTKEASDA